MTNDGQPHYETDEECLALEIEWILKKTKRSSKNSTEVSPGIITKENSLSSNSENKAAKNRKPKYEPRPPLTMILNICNYQELNNQIKDIAKSAFVLKILNKGIHKVSAASSDDHRSMTKILAASEPSWYSYEDKQMSPVKAIIKNLPNSSSISAIADDLKEQGLNVLNENKLRRKTREPLNMFLSTFDSYEDVKKIYEIKLNLQSVVLI